MGKTALLFPGQGSQKVGMGAELARTSAAAREAWAEADDALGLELSTLAWEGPEAELVLTANAQPAILTASIAVLRALAEREPVSFDYVAGHSLGEWTALVAAGALAFADAVKLVHLRGTFMQDAVPAGVGAMAALLGLDAAQVAAVCAEAAGGEVCAPANLNGAGQIVISGHAGAVERAMVLAKQRGAKRAVPLQVSAPFHSPLMAPAAERLAAALAPIAVGTLRVPVMTNVEAAPNQDSARVKALLVEQMTAPVRWEESVLRLAELGVEDALEIGAGSVLVGLVKRIAPSVRVTFVEGIA